MREASAREEKLGLREDELAFLDALETNDSAVKVLGDETLRAIAQELVEAVRNDVTIERAVRDEKRGEEGVEETRIPPDKQDKAVETVIEQVELLSEEWVNV